jgi:hypothetical protein
MSTVKIRAGSLFHNIQYRIGAVEAAFGPFTPQFQPLTRCLKDVLVIISPANSTGLIVKSEHRDSLEDLRTAGLEAQSH